MEKFTFTRVCLSYARVIVATTRILVIELHCHTVMGWLTVLKYLLLDACGCLWPCLVMPGIKCCCLLRNPAPLVLI
jgi:hypothetical protein